MQHRTYLTALAAILAAAIVTDANATGSHTSTPPKQTPATPATPPVYVGGSPSASSGATAGSTSTATSGSVAGATASTGPVSAAGGTANAAGGAGGSSGDSSATTGPSSATLQDSSSFWSQSRALGLTFAPGAFTPPMAPVQCASATITQSARGLGMGLLSSADSKTDSSDCTLINLRNAAVAACKFETAKQIEDLLTQKHLPAFKPTQITYLKDKLDPGYVDYSPTQCALLTSPPPKPAEPTVLNWIYVPPPAARVEDKPAEPAVPAKPVPPAKPKKPNPAKNISTKPPASKGGGTTLNCGEDGIPQCVAKPRKPLALVTPGLTS